MKRLAAMLLILGVVIVACKQGKGERCQVMDDCDTGLVCNQATNTCQETTGGGIDATVPPMEGPRDAPIDAAPDSPPPG